MSIRPGAMYLGKRLAIYWDRADWWVGCYRGRGHLYVCPIPCLVFRWERR